MSKRKGLKLYHYQEKGSFTIHSFYTDTIEDAKQQLNRVYGEGNYILSSLDKAFSKKEVKKLYRII